MKKKILITCANGVPTYKLFSKLKKNFIIYGTDINNIGVGKTQCDYFYKSPPPKNKKFIDFLNKILNQVDLAFLYSDEEIEAVTKYMNKNSPNFKKLVLSDEETLKNCLDKNLFNKFIKTKKNSFFKIPTVKINKKNVIKPKKGRGSKNILITKNKAIINFFLKKDQDFIVQEFIDGKEFTVDCYFNKQGKLEEYVLRERLIKSNVSLSCKIIKGSKIKKYLIYLSTIFNFNGPINVQYIQSGKNFYLIEINPRLSGSISFSMETGFDPFQLAAKEYLNYNYKSSKKSNSIFYHRYYEFIKIKKII